MPLKDNTQNNLMFGSRAATIDPKVVSGFFSVDNLRAIQPADLTDPKMFEKIAMFVRGVDDEGAGFRAKETFEILLGLVENVPALDEGMLRDYFALLVILKLNFIGLMEIQEIERFLREQVLFAISIRLFFFTDMDFLFDLQEKFTGFIKFDIWYLPEEEKKEIVKSLTKALESNEEYLGEDDLNMDGKLVFQTMANWLMDYNQSSHTQFEKRGAFERTKYLNTSLLVRNLDANQRKILEKFLEFYDWLKSDAKDLVHNEGLNKLNAIIEAENKLEKNKQAQQGQPLTVSLPQREPGLPMGEVELPPVPLPPRPQVQPQVTQPVIAPPSITINPPSVAAPVVAPSPAKAPAIDVKPPVDPLVLVKKQETKPFELSSRPVSNRVNDKAKVIDLKLEALKKRAGRNNANDAK